MSFPLSEANKSNEVDQALKHAARWIFFRPCIRMSGDPASRARRVVHVDGHVPRRSIAESGGVRRRHQQVATTTLELRSE